MDNQDREKIDAYLLKKMDGETRQAFEARMAEEPALAEEVRLAEESFYVLDALGDQNVRTMLDEIHDKVVGEESSPTKSKTKVWLPLVIGLLLLLSLAYYFLRNKNTLPTGPLASTEIYTQYYETYPLSFAKRSEEELDILLQQVNVLYKSKKYDIALPILEKVIAEEDKDARLQLAAGISALQTRSYDQALNYFNAIIKKADPLYQNQARWYAALTELQQDNPNNAKVYLQVLAKSEDGFKKKESQEILDLLKTEK